MRWFLMSTVVARRRHRRVGLRLRARRLRLRQVPLRRAGRLLFNVMFSSLSIPFAVILVPLFVILVKTGPRQSVVRPDRAVGGARVRDLHDAAVHRAVDPGLGAGGRPDRRGGRVRHLPAHRAAAAAALARAPWPSGPSCRATTASCGRWCWSPTAPSTPCRWACRPCSCRRTGSTTWCWPAPCWPSCPPSPSSCVLRKQLLEGLSTGAVKG